MRKPTYVWTLGLLSLLIGLGTGQPLLAAEARFQGTSTAIITNPGSGALLTGIVPILGTAADENFAQYVLEFAPDPPVNDVWFAIQPPVAQQVQENVLGAWDTSGIEDGRYLVRLRVIRNDGTEFSDQVRVFISNATATPTATITPVPTATATQDLSAPGEAAETATPLIWQPPTRTPRPGAAAPNSSPTPRSIDLTGGGPLPADTVGRAVRLGIFMALGTFAALGAYLVLRAAIRRGPRAVWWQFRREVLGPLMNSIRKDRSQ